MHRVSYYFNQFTLRMKRMGWHLAYPVYKRRANRFPPGGILEWTSDTLFYLFDCMAIPEIYDAIMNLLKTNTRPLTAAEVELGYNVFGNSIDYNLIRIDDRARFGTKNMAAAYVSFNTINYMHKIKKEVFIHELVHIWQFQNFGSIYIARAIKAQRSSEGYNYGGSPNLYQVMLRGGSLFDFNFEQQADIIEDYYKMKQNPAKAGPMLLQTYNYFANQLFSIA